MWGIKLFQLRKRIRRFHIERQSQVFNPWSILDLRCHGEDYLWAEIFLENRRCKP